MFKAGKTSATIVNDEDLYFVRYNNLGVAEVLGSVPLNEFLTERKLFPVPEDVARINEHIIVVPDYWLGDFDFRFQTKKRSIVESYIERKLGTDYNHTPETGYFYDYFHYKTRQGNAGFHVYFLQDPRSFQLYERLVEHKLNPVFITAPGLIWERRVHSTVPDFSKDGRLLVHLTQNVCFFYFFFMGHYLFSRSIPLPDNEASDSEMLGTIGHEINQSFYSFSQKTKSEVGHISLLSNGQTDTYAGELAEILGREVRDLGDQSKEFRNIEGNVIGPASHFTIGDLSASQRFLNIVNKQVKTRLTWRPIQRQGIAVGICLLVLLVTQAVFLRQWLPFIQDDFVKSGMSTKTEYRQTLSEYHDALERLINESRRQSAHQIIVKVSESLPDNIRLEKMTVKVDPEPSVYLEGKSVNAGPERFKESLLLLLSNIKSRFPGCGYLFLKDVDFEKDKKSDHSNPHVYKFKFRFPL